jgi:hypothetical protein
MTGMQTAHDIQPSPDTGVRLVVWCRCCLDAGCPQHMEHVDEPVECVVCGEQCQCIGCAANTEPPSDDY